MNAETSSSVVVARNLTRIYSLGATEVTGLTNVDLEIATGHLVVLKGTSGSGKSTLLSLLAGLDRPTRGDLRVADVDLVHTSQAQLTQFRRKTVGMVFQTFNLLPTLSVIENVCLPALLAGDDYPAVRKKAKALLNWLNLDTRRHHRSTQLSGGEMQRCAIARALINDPAVILADEPTGNLDSRNGQLVMELLAELNRRWRCTVVVATHSRLADPFATLQLHLKDGQISERS